MTSVIRIAEAFYMPLDDILHMFVSTKMYCTVPVWNVTVGRPGDPPLQRSRKLTLKDMRPPQRSRNLSLKDPL